MAESLFLAMKKELECAICFELMKEPKIVGSCNHVFCKECLRKCIAKGTSGTFPCPKCRVEYTIPTDGIEGLKDDFRTASLVEILLKEEPSRLTNPKHMCSECERKDDVEDGGSMAEFLCDACDIDLCSGCRHDHSKAPGFADHIIYDLCSTHWRRMKHFCRSCSIVMCGLCMKSDHSDKTHETVLYKDSFEKEISKILKKAGDTLAGAKLKHDDVVEAARVVKKEVKSRRNAVADSANAIVESSNSEIVELQSKIQEMQNKVLKLEKNVDQVIARKDRFNKAEDEAVHGYSKCVAAFKEVLSSDLISALYRHSERIRQLKTTQCLGGSHNESVINCKREIRKLIVNIDEINRAQPKPRKLAPVPILNEEFPEFTEAKRFKEWVLKDDIERIFSIEILPKECGVAVLCGTSALRNAYASKICFSPSLEPNDIKIISDGVTTGVDMTVTSNGDLILLLKEQPHVRSYRYNGHGLSKVEDLKMFNDIGNPKSIALDESRNIFFILCTKPGVHVPEAEIMLFDMSNGAMVKRVDCRYSGRLTCDNFGQRVFKCYPRVESYDVTTFSSSKSWDVPQIDIVDVKFSSGGLYAAGRQMPRRELVLYRIGSDENIRPIGPLLDGNGKGVVCDRPCNPRSAVRGDLLLIGVGRRVIFYRMV